MNFWVVKAREIKEDGSQGWHWRSYLRKADVRQARGWGGPDWIRNPLSKKLIRTKVAKGDIAVCYQTDEPSILGITRMASNGMEDPPDSGDYNRFDLISSRRAFRLDPVLTIDELRATGSPRAFGRAGRGTVLELSASEFQDIERAISKRGMQQKLRIQRWLKRGVKGDDPIDPREADDRHLAALEKKLAGRGDVYTKEQIDQLIRKDAPLVRALKARYEYRCQFPACRAKIPTRSGGLYCEVAHLQPVAKGGAARRVNLVVLCPNHHKMIDHGDFRLLKSTARDIVGVLNGRRFRIHR